MQQIAFVTGADRGLGLALSAGLLERGWHVFAGQYMPDWPELAALLGQFPESLRLVPLDVSSMGSVRAAAQAVASSAGWVDMLVNNAGVISTTSAGSIREPQDYDKIHWLYDINAVGPLRVVEAFLPLLDRGQMKRLCFVSSEAGSIDRCRRENWYGYCMSKTALNMAVKIMFNHLRLQGYTFRLYHPGWMRTYMEGSKNTKADMEPEESAAQAIPFFIEAQADEDRLVLRDWQGHVWPW
ncbi:MAG: SDR family NAD(P)-dependent oxidoreductase [Anaerolineae bacterium]|nr:SDR family NAD(P)-dependent oxidoreductase [Anaerolineae bacterium]